MMKKSVHERAGRASRCRVDDESRRFVDDRQMRVLEKNVEVNILGGDRTRRRVFDNDPIAFAYDDLGRLVGDLHSFEGDCSLGDEPRNSGTAQMRFRWHVPCQCLIKSLGRIGPDGDRDDRGRHGRRSDPGKRG